MNQILIPIIRLQELNGFLAQKSRVKDQPKNTICQFATEFADGFEAIIKVANGTDDSGPYVDAMLFRDGHELLTMVVCDRLDGVYKFQFAQREPFEVTVTGIAKLVVACENANGEPDFFFVKCIGNADAFDEGTVHECARQEAVANGYAFGKLVYDECGPYASSFMELFVWASASVLDFRNGECNKAGIDENISAPRGL